MQYLGLALFAEGEYDHRFLRPLLRRLCEDTCARFGEFPMEVSDVLELHTPWNERDADRETRVFSAARDSRGAWHILFVHTDGAGDPLAARAERVEPACRRIEADLENLSQTTVAVVPVRETEAWALADGETLRRVFGTGLDDRALDLPATGPEIEGILDPKKRLDEIYRTCRSPRRRRMSASALLEPIGERIALKTLQRIPAFQALETELRDALRRLHFIRT